MELSINKKAFDLLKERYGEQRFAEERFQSGFEVFIFEIKAISCGIFGEINEDDATKVFEAEIGWGYSVSTRIKKQFPYSLDGIYQACEWFDEQRIRLAMELL